MSGQTANGSAAVGVFAAVAVLMALAIGGCTARSAPPSVDVSLSRSADASASSSSPGQPASGLTDSPESLISGQEWRSLDQTVGAWTQLTWGEPHLLRRVVIARPPLGRPGVRAGYLTFEDGSFVQVRLSASEAVTTIPIASRATDRVRFTASEVDAGAQHAELAELAVGTQPAHGDVDEDDPDGDAAINAELEASPDVVEPLDGLVDGTGAGDSAYAISVPGPGTTLDLTWPSPRELTRIDVTGGLSTARITAARLTLADGAEVRIGEVAPDPQHPTRVALMPRVTTSVRLTIDRVEGVGRAVLSKVGAFTRRAPPAHAISGVASPSRDAPGPGPCLAPQTLPQVLRVLCPTAGSEVGTNVALVVQAPPGSSEVTAVPWSAEGGQLGSARSTHVGPGGTAVLGVETGALPAGPLTVGVTARGPGRADQTLYFPLRRPLTVAQPPLPSALPARGRTLVYSEEFDRPLSLSRNGRGADYATAKPNLAGAEDFGDAIFADPALGFGSLQVVDGSFLRIGVEPLPSGYSDPNSSDRRHLGGLLSSARAGGSGFSAQYAYFEARIAAPASPGTWPAFWMLPSDNLSVPEPKVAGREYHEIFGAEIDAVEFYGHDPDTACHSTHDYEHGRRGGIAQCGARFSDARDALSWHDYGVSMTPTENTFFIDGHVVATAPQVPGGASPMFFLLDFALGGGWPVDLSGTNERSQLYVDHVRVFV